MKFQIAAMSSDVRKKLADLGLDLKAELYFESTNHTPTPAYKPTVATLSKPIPVTLNHWA